MVPGKKRRRTKWFRTKGFGIIQQEASKLQCTCMWLSYHDSGRGKIKSKDQINKKTRIGVT
jgi:hypothetical protein